jgi:sulfite reductase alpha subunit-like flavoprotein
MIGPGTGVAPMRALIYERIAWRQEEVSDEVDLKESRETPKDILFFGCRNSNADFFFKSEWEELAQKSVALDVFPAFSRDQV